MPGVTDAAASRFLNLGELRAVKAAIRRAVEDGGGLRAVEERLGVSRTQLQRYSSPHHVDLPRLDTAVALDRTAGEAQITATVAGLLGSSLNHLEVDEQESMLARLGRVALQSGEVLASAAAALADQRVTRAEREEIERHVLALQSATAAFIVALRAGDRS